MGVANEQGRRRDAQDRQILKSPAQVVILCEANETVEEMLKQPPVSGDDDQHPQSRLERRATHGHWVVRGNEQGSAVLVAARTDTCDYLHVLEHEVHEDHPYRENGKNKIARSRMLFCKVGFKQNIGHCGKEIVVCGVNGHNRTMKFEWPAALEEF